MDGNALPQKSVISDYFVGKELMNIDFMGRINNVILLLQMH